MKVLALIARVLLGLMFVVFGLNGFLHFINQPAPTGLAADFEGALFKSGFLMYVFAIQLVSGLILLSNRFVPLGLVLLGPIIAVVVLFHITMAPAGILPGAVALVLFLVVFYSVRSAFSGIFQSKVAE